ncbi:MFS transporter [Agromyces atrinae]|uniref:Fucose permease n=1 Tax=Agromyces atrinae TaxID=592376 RepID=A0A4Q2M7M8_9MICO|nr:MFS transporter [Agromyces atrinae]NYD67753.1 fucose permease [Agromyces atrinae]RXZ88059.1 MFS transporter [Agromyces atrinae]
MTEPIHGSRTPRTRPAPMSAALRRRKWAIFVFMLIVGISFASWVVRTPAVRDAIDASTAQMGLVLFGLSIGSMTGLLSSATIIRALGARWTVLIGGSSLLLGVFLMGTMAGASSAIGVFFGLLFFGIGMGMAEIAINIEGARIEQLSGHSVMPTLHGCFSLGTVIGATIGIALNAIAFPVILHLVLAGAVGVAALLWAIPGIAADTGREDRSIERPKRTWGSRLSVWRDSRLVLLGVILLALALAEGSASDWLPLLMVDGHGVSATFGSVIFTAFAVAMTIGRFSGGPLLARFGPVVVLRASAVVAGIGIALVVFADNAFVAGAAVLLWGLGAALGFPICLSAAADSEDSTASVAAVATAGYIAFLVGPPLLGFVGEHIGLRLAMLVVLAMVAIAVFLAPAARPREKVAA